MIKTFLKYFLSLSTALFLFQAQAAEQRATPDEAVAMVKRAVAYLKEHGREKAFAEFNNPKGQFIDRELYVLVFDLKGVNLAHGNNPKLVGKSLLDMKDAEGTPIIRSFVDIANTKGKGWFDYHWPNPVTHNVDRKSTYLEKYEDLIVGVGIYKP